MLSTLNRRWEASPVLANLMAALVVGIAVAYAANLYGGLPLIGFVGAAVLLVFMDRVELGVLFIGIYTPYEEFLLKFFPLSQSNTIRFGSEVFIIGMLCAVLLRNLAQGRRFRLTPIDAPLALFVAWALISAVANETPPVTAVLGLRIILRYALLYYVVVHAGFKRKTIVLFVKLFLIAATVQICLGLASGAIGGAFRAFLMPNRGIDIGGMTITAERTFTDVPRGAFISGTMLNMIHYGIFVTVAWLVMLSLRIKGYLMSRWVYVLLLLGFIAVLASAARQAFVALAVGIIVVLFGAGKTKLALRLVTGIFFVMLVATVYANVFMPRTREGVAFLGRWASGLQFQNMGTNPENNFRVFLMFDVSGRLISRSPAWGLGPGTFGSALSVAEGDPIYAELGVARWATSETNFVSDVNWVTLLGQFGLVGTGLFVLILVSMAAYSLRLSRSSDDRLARGLALGHMGCVAVVAVDAFFNPIFEMRPISLYLWLFGAMVVSLRMAEVNPQLSEGRSQP